MDVERIQKVNNLALDLMKQGLASNREEAVSQAENIFKERDTEDYADIRERMEEPQPKEQQQQQSSENTLSQDEIKNILHKNKEFIVKTFKAMQEKIDYFEREMAFLKSKVNSVGPKVKEIVTNEVPPPSQEPQAEQQQNETQTQQQQAPEQKGESHPRSGNYAENDVSIEKFFYMGNK
jgi:hypothetical protein